MRRHEVLSPGSMLCAREAVTMTPATVAVEYVSVPEASRLDDRFDVPVAESLAGRGAVGPW